MSSFSQLHLISTQELYEVKEDTLASLPRGIESLLQTVPAKLIVFFNYCIFFVVSQMYQKLPISLAAYVNTLNILLQVGCFSLLTTFHSITIFLHILALPTTAALYGK